MLYTKQPKFNPRNSKGLLARIQNVLDAHSSFIENIQEGDNILIRKNANGGITIDSTAKGGGGAVGSYGFSIYATEDAGDYVTSILGGPAQALGQAPYIYQDKEIGILNSGDLIWLEYSLTNFSWNPTIKSGTSDFSNPAIYYVVLGQVGSQYVRNVRQDRLGAVEIVLTDTSVDV